MHQNTFLITQDVQKHLFRKIDFGGLEVCANASKHVFNHYRRLGVCANASEHVLITPDSKNFLF